jgi:hypothetical protein
MAGRGNILISRFSPLDIRLEKPVCGTCGGLFRGPRAATMRGRGEVAEWLKAAPC